MYYLRTRPAVDAVQFTVDKTRLKEYSTANIDKSSKSGSNSTPGSADELTTKMMECAVSGEGDCLMCSS